MVNVIRIKQLKTEKWEKTVKLAEIITHGPYHTISWCWISMPSGVNTHSHMHKHTNFYGQKFQETRKEPVLKIGELNSKIDLSQISSRVSTSGWFSPKT